jgi:hypothetical protein
MSYIGNQPFNAAFVTDTFSGDGSTAVFNMNIAPANPASALVAVSGILQDPSTYSVLGRILTFTQAPPAGVGNISVRYLGLPASNVASTAYRSVTEFTASAGQTTFTPASYTPGFINVFRSGVRLGTSNYVATNGVTVVLNNPALAGDLITIESFFVSSVLNAIPNVAGAITPALLDSTSQSGSGALLLPSGTTAQRPALPQVGMQRWNTTLGTMEVFVGGGTGWQTIASTAYSLEYVIVAGGGGAGSGNGPPSASGGGGGAGGYRSSVAGESSGGGALAETPLTITPGATYSVVVGAGGVGQNDLAGTSGNISSLGTIVSLGGGGGGCGNAASGQPLSGGSGGGHDYGAGAAGTAGQGFAGGNGRANGGSDYYGGGGGGAGQVGASSTLGVNGAGGNGVSSNITGTATFRAGGGGSGKYNFNNGAAAALGGLGGGGRGSDGTGAGGSAGTVNTGGGGGGGPRATPFAGGSGIVIVRYAGAQRGSGGVVTSSGGFTIHTFTTSGTFVG